jgi:hypothetical protein
VAQIRGRPVFKITDVALIPLSSQADADRAIAAARAHAQRHSNAQAAGLGDTDSDDDDDDDAPSVTDSLIEESATTASEAKDAVTGQKSAGPRETSVAADVMQRKGVYGRFADKWFSRKGWSADSRRTQGLSCEENRAATAPQNVDSTLGEEQPAAPSAADALPSDLHVQPEAIPKALAGQKDANTVALLPKVLQTTRMYFASGNFFFSYDYDLSHSIGSLQPNSSLPLFKQFDPLVRLPTRIAFTR